MKPTTRKRHPKCDHGVYKDMCDICKPAPRQIPGQDGVWRQDKKDKARKRTLTVPFQGVPYGKLTRLIAGWPDENRPETMVPREESEALAKVCEGILNGTETIISMRDAFIAYRAKHSAPDAGKEVKPPKSKEDIRHVIKDFWQERYGSVHQRMNERTEEEIKELAKRIHSLIYEQ